MIKMELFRWLLEPSRRDLRVGASVGHGQQTGAAVLVLEVLIGELLTVDGATTGALFNEAWVLARRS